MKCVEVPTLTLVPVFWNRCFVATKDTTGQPDEATIENALLESNDPEAEIDDEPDDVPTQGRQSKQQKISSSAKDASQAVEPDPEEPENNEESSPEHACSQASSSSSSSTSSDNEEKTKEATSKKTTVPKSAPKTKQSEPKAKAREKAKAKAKAKEKQSPVKPKKKATPIDTSSAIAIKLNPFCRAAFANLVSVFDLFTAAHTFELNGTYVHVNYHNFMQIFRGI